MGSSLGPDISESGLVLCLDAADKNSYPGTGTTWTDLSGNNNISTLTNGPTFNSSNGGNVVFDGVDDYVDCGNNVALTFASQSITVITFAKISSVVSKNTLISFNGAFNFFLPGNRLTTTYQLYWDATSGWKNGNKSSWNVGEIYGLAWTITGTTLTFYVNGVSDGSTTIATNFAPTSQTRIGFANGGEYATGSIYNIYCYNRSLTASEVLQNYNATKSRFGL
jgi:hypothetical protein